MIYKLFVRPFLFLIDPESGHGIVIKLLEWLGNHPLLIRAISTLFTYENSKLETNLFGLTFRNPVGLAAGFDKDARVVNALLTLGFGYLEVGSVSAQTSPGNPSPRIFRLKKDKAIINRMGIPSAGADVAANRLAKLKGRRIPLGLNLNFTTCLPLSRAEIIADYLYTFKKCYAYADYFAVNISCPNLPEVEFDPMRPEDLGELLQRLTEENRRLSEGLTPKPILLKISPDLSEEELDQLLGVAQGYIDGIIAVNTTQVRRGLRTRDETLVNQEGGLSGRPLRDRAREIVAYIHQKTEGRLPIIGVGGVFTAQDAFEMIKAGASLVQIYTGLIYGGPGVVKRINKGLVKLLQGSGRK